MSTLKELFKKELAELETLRDELKVKAHLAKADLSDELEKLDRHWPEVERVAREVETGINEAGAQVEKAARQVVGELKKAYHELAERQPKP